MIRKAVPSDICSLIKLSNEALELNSYDGLILSLKKIREVITYCISSSQHFFYISEHNGEIVAALAAQVEDMAIYERKQASIVMFFSKKAGDGIKLFREFMKWVNSRIIIKSVIISMNVNLDNRIGKLFERFGFDYILPTYLYVR